MSSPLRIFVPAERDGHIIDRDEVSAIQGFEQMGATVHYYLPRREEEIENPDCVVGGVFELKRAMRSLGIKLPDWNDYPDSLSMFLGRKIDKMPVEAMLTQKLPVFIKPVFVKQFEPFICRKKNDYSRVMHIEGDLCYMSQVVNFISEWRAFVVDGRVVDCRPYKGAWFKYPSSEMIKLAVKYATERGDMPLAYALDFGIVDDGRCILVEANDGWALGSYGLAPKQYAELLLTRWREMTVTIMKDDNNAR